MIRRYFRGQLVALLHGLSVFATLGISLWANSDEFQDRARHGKAPGNQTYDFIIVGAGSAGSVVAYRLSQKYKVLLLEAGGEPFPLTAIPSMALQMLNYEGNDWMHNTVPQRNSCLALVNQESGWSQGKGLGGTSNLNFLIHSRGNPKDFENWANFTGDQNWNYDGVLPFFKMSEDFEGEYKLGDIHGKGGPIHLQVPPATRTANVFVKAGQEFGYPKADLNGRYTEGFDKVNYAIKRGLRQGAYSTYIKRARRQRNLKIEKFARVNKVLLRGKDNEAYGVEYERHGRIKYAFATKEVIVSAGIQSPKVLMLSGIGPQDHLEEKKIKTKVNLPPVGQNLQDHIAVYLGPFFLNPGQSLVQERDFKVIKEYAQWALVGTGDVTTTGVNGLAFIASSFAKAEGKGDWPDIQFMYGGTGINNDYAKEFARAFHVRQDILSKYYEHARGKDAFFIAVSVARPVQRGEILLKSSTPDAELIIDPRYLENDRDIKVLVEGMKKAVEIVEQSASFQSIGGRFTTEPFPGCESLPFRSDDYWECLARQYSITLHHIVGSCSMGAQDSKEAVVDTKLRVKGTRNLRVIDASVMPFVPVGNTNAPTVMIGEKGADFILRRWSTL